MGFVASACGSGKQENEDGGSSPVLPAFVKPAMFWDHAIKLNSANWWPIGELMGNSYAYVRASAKMCDFHGWIKQLPFGQCCWWTPGSGTKVGIKGCFEGLRASVLWICPEFESRLGSSQKSYLGVPTNQTESYSGNGGVAKWTRQVFYVCRRDVFVIA